MAYLYIYPDTLYVSSIILNVSAIWWNKNALANGNTMLFIVCFSGLNTK